MPIPIRLEEGHGIRSVLGEWAQHIERELHAHFPAMSVSRTEQDHEMVLVLGEGGAARAEIVLRWHRSAPNEINIFPRPPGASAESKAKAGTLAFRVAAACVIAVCALWLGAAIGYWNDFRAISGVRDKAVVLLVAAVAWVLTTSGLAVAAYHLVERSHRAIDAPRVQRSRQWIDTELWPWLQAVLGELQQRARKDLALALRLAV